VLKAMLIGHGAREHVIGETLVKGGVELVAYMKNKNPGIYSLSSQVFLGELSDFNKILDSSKGVDFCIIGPEDPLAEGIVNFLENSGIPCVGPRKEVALLESSKSFARALLQKYNIPGNPAYRICCNLSEVEDAVNEIGLENIVVKPDGLTGGKGVKVYGEHLKSKDEVLEYCKNVLSTHSKVILEEKLEGEEFTLQAFVDGSTVVGMPLVQDHKRAYNNDEGPNTGGMGSYSCEDHLLPFLERKHVEDALKTMKLTVDAVKKDTGIPYKGILYGQFMLTPNGVKLVEYNVRFGDPEAMNVLPLLENNFVDICERIIDGTLSGVKVSFSSKATVVKYLAPTGYPVNPKPTEVMVDEEKIKEVGGKLYYASVNKEDGKITTTSSRSIAVLGVGNTVYEAERIAEGSIKYIKGNLFHRSDIGTKQLIQKRIEHMKRLLGET